MSISERLYIKWVRLHPLDKHKSKSQIESYALGAKVDELYMKLFGIRSSRQNWDSVKDLSWKDNLSVEAKFRAAENLRRLPAGPLARKDTDREERRFKFAIG